MDVSSCLNRFRRVFRRAGNGAGRAGREAIAIARPSSDERLKRLHHFERVQRQFAARAMRPPGADRLRHVGETEATVIVVGVGRA